MHTFPPYSFREKSLDLEREQLSCLDLTCRMGCDYGFELGANRCPTCQCRDPCSGVTCPAGRACAVVDVACDADYCPPVPACLPRKPGQCPFLVPSNGACEWSCRADAECGAGERCCATGCGTACAQALHQTACEQRRALVLHVSAESGSPPRNSWVPSCTSDGAYEKIQCRASDNVCWCVDQAGLEIAGTRAVNATPNCETPLVCPEQCEDVIQCPHGRELDTNGCPTCACADPCATAKCRDDETCQIITPECESDSCPSLAYCAPAALCPGGAQPLDAPDGSGALRCGPTAAACPSSHACRFAPHDATPPVCCPKPRSVCLESPKGEDCVDGTKNNSIRWYFNPERNRCERFRRQGCLSSHNNFRSKEECNAVCPILSSCERLREKNEVAAQKYGSSKGTFIPACDASGAWEPVQCMQHIDVCWCVSARGEPLKGSLVRGAKPICNFRQARKWVRRDPLDQERAKADEVLEELIRQMTTYRIAEFENEDDLDDSEMEQESREEQEPSTKEDADAVTRTDVIDVKPAELAKDRIERPIEVATEKLLFKTKCQLVREEAEHSGESLKPRCLADGSFAPRQCTHGRCWCVDAAGQRRPHSSDVSDMPEPDPCEQTNIESASLELELVGVDAMAGERARSLLAARLAALGARVPITVNREKNVLRLRALLNGPRAADMVKQEKLASAARSDIKSALGADVIRSEYRLTAPIPAMQQREIISESTVSAATSYHTALIVLAASAAFIISVLCVLVMLYRARLQREPHKAERFLPPAPPVYVLSADEKAELAKVLHVPPAPVPPPVFPSEEESSSKV
ncbi:Papilin [Eumeta japonica]|uniref:Papilin n=1 Tax=Eumeta variegata TaxID=151549 RepID=A0A4C1TE77_EUMVA|nr:Papilin [Eumeta japonica]